MLKARVGHVKDAARRQRQPERDAEPPNSRSISAFLLGELSVDGPLDLSRLLHDRRAHTGRRFLESGISVGIESDE